MMEFNNTRRGNFLGHDGFIWWVGVVENRKDPLNLGRCQVRIKGIHSESKTQIDYSSLPWAQPLFPVNNSFSTPTTVKEGDIVVGFFLDGDAAQFPVMFGMFHGIPETEADPNSGFNDPRTKEELKKAPKKPKSIEFKTDGSGAKITESDTAASYPNRLDEPTVSRLARNESIKDTIVESKKNSVVEVDTVSGKWKEPQTPYNAQYPYNQVLSTEAGHYMEFDDTPGAERTHSYHRSGTFVETHPDGSVVEKVVKDKYTIIMKDDNVYVMGKCSITVQGDAQILVKKQCDLKVEKDLNFSVAGDWNCTVKGKWNTNVSSAVNHKSGGDTVIKASNIRLN